MYLPLAVEMMRIPVAPPNPELIRSQGPVVLPGSYGWQPRVEAGGLTGKSWYLCPCHGQRFAQENGQTG